MVYWYYVAQKLPKRPYYALDWAMCLEVARENAANRVDGPVSPDARERFDVDYGTGYDAILITKLLHHFTPADNERVEKGICRPQSGGPSGNLGVFATRTHNTTRSGHFAA